MRYIEKGSKTFNTAIWMLFFGGFVTFAILYSTQPILPLLSNEFHISPAIASLSLSVSTGALAVSMIIFASISEVYGRKKMMVISLLLSSVFVMLTAFSPNYGTLLVLRTIQGIVLAGLPAIAMAYINEEFHPASLGLVMGLYISGNSIGGMSGRIISGMLSDFFSWRVAMFGIGLISLVLSVVFFKGLPPSKNFKPQAFRIHHLMKTLVHHLKDPALFMLYCTGFILMGSFVTMYNYIGYKLIEPPYYLSPSSIGWLFIVYIVGTFSSTWMGKLSDKIGVFKTLIISIVIMFLGAILTMISPLIWILIGLAIFTYGFFAAHSVASSWVGKRTSQEKAQSSSLYLFFYYFGSSIGGFVGGYCWIHFGWIGVITMISSFMIIGILLSFALKPFEGKKETTM